MRNIFYRTISPPGTQTASFNSCAQTTLIQRHLPSVARMGTGLSVMLLSDGMAFLRSAASRSGLAADACLASTPQTLLAPRLMASDKPEVSDQPTTSAYGAEGYLTGIRSSVIVPQPPKKVFDSLATDLHLIFGSIEECKDRIKSDDCCGTQVIQRFVKIPFTIGYFSGAIKMSMAVENDRPRGEIQFDSSHGRFLSKFEATFNVTPIYGKDERESTLVELDTRMNVKRLPPPPLKGLVKGVIKRKIDNCMRDLTAFHARQPLDSMQSAVTEQLSNIQPCAEIQRRLNTERRDERHSIL